MKVEYIIPIRTISEANWHGHWAVRSKRVKAQRDIAKLLTMKNAKPMPNMPVAVKITRIAPRELDNGDNLPASLKAIRDGIADALNPNAAQAKRDRDGITWSYSQVKNKKYAVLVEIEEIA